ncbi:MULTISPECIES: HNH endonuclease signature motif containing protein [unclassified Microbacterium]|uniref:HNH endonuclease signature motif containing protein n=1 Tax=unclassified Microbacterium TaxID=2609290 RepID=UPI003421A015
MTALIDATDSQMAALAGLVESLQVAEQTLAAMQAARDGLLAIAGRLAIDIARQGDHPDRGDHAIRSVAAEIGAVQRVSDRTIERRMADATLLVEQFPSVWAAQGAGLISAAHSRVIVDAGSHLVDDADREAYAETMVPLAAEESANRLRPRARREAERLLARSIDERHREARATRRVWMTDADDGMADLHVHAPAVLVHGMFDRLSQAAHAVRDENRRLARESASEDGGSGKDASSPDGRTVDERTVDEIRADLLTDLVLTGAPSGHDTADGMLGAIRARVEITVPVLTLMDDQASTSLAFDDVPALPPAELDGVEPIDVDTARSLAGSTTGWDRVLTHPITGRMLAVDRYRPSEHLRRHLRARDRRCRFPACGIAARKCDLDHNHDAATGGETRDTNLAQFCRRHHVLKHHSPWHVRQRHGGILEWTSPTGRIYSDKPPTQHTVTFAPEPAAPVPARAPF